MQEDSIAHAAQRFDYLYDTYLSGTNCRLYLSVIPDKNAFLASSHGYPALDYGAFTQSLREKTPYLTYLPIGDLLSLEDYYRTDLHWRQEQLTDVAARLLADLHGKDKIARAEEHAEEHARDVNGFLCGEFLFQNRFLSLFQPRGSSWL